MDPSPVRGSQRRTSRGPLSSRSNNITSPSKSVYLDTKCAEDGTPWHIKVTVEAERASQAINRSIRSSKLATKGTDASSPVKRPVRRSRKTASSPARKTQPTTKPTLNRPRANSVQTHDLIGIPDDATNDYSLSEIEPAYVHVNDESASSNNGAINDIDFQPSFRNYSITSGSNTDSPKQHEEQSVQSKQPEAAHPTLPDKDAQHTSPGFPAVEDWSENEEEDAVLGAEDPGEATMLESEEFSMISVDSLSSHPRLDHHLASQTLTNPSRKSAPTKSTDVSWMPSSPPTYLPAYRHTPMPSDSPPKYPAAPAQSSLHHSNVETPLQESARKSGKALQDVVTGPFRTSTARPSSSADGIFAGFSTGTRRQLRESLHTGQSLATPQMGSQPNFGLGLHGAPQFAQPASKFSSPFQSPVRRNSNSVTHRLPTPEDKDAPAQTGASSEPAGEVHYPIVAETMQDMPAVSTRGGHNDTAWAAKTTSEIKSPLGQHVQDNTSESSPSSGQPGAATPESEVLEEDYQTESQQENPPPQKESEAPKDIWQDEDIWQEEASRSVVDDDTPPLFRDELYVKPRRAKLPGTWRRTSEANFHYSDSPEPQDTSLRKVSAATSASGIMTPPVTEDERAQPDAAEPDDDSEVVDEGDASEVGRNIFSPVRSIRSCISSDGDDTGVFWQSNLPAVFNRPSRPSRRRARTEMSTVAAVGLDDSVAGDMSFAGSPLRNTILDISPMKPERSPVKTQRVIGGIKRNPQSDSALMPTPLRQSLLKSSKMRGSPIGISYRSGQGSSASSSSQMSSHAGERTDASFDNGNSSSMASDARQLHAEFTQQLDPTRNNTCIDLTQLSSSESELTSESGGTPQSYVEELNRDSPVRIRVNFNDPINEPQHVTNNGHDQAGRSILLSPKKQYPPLFANAPSLKPSNGPASRDEPPNAARPRVREGGFVSRLTDSFWDVVTAPAPTGIKPAIVVSPSPSPAPAKLQQVQSDSASIGSSVPDHVLRLRRKYGLLPPVHPFTYRHVRTLHRMLNSVRSRTSGTCIIPSSGHLPASLARLVGQTKTNDLDQSFIWTEAYVHVLASFMSLLLPASERRRLEQHTGKEWGDEETLRYKGYDSKGRHGTEKVFPKEVKGKIEVEWVAEVVEGIIWKEEMNAKKKKVKDMLAKAKELDSSVA